MVKLAKASLVLATLLALLQLCGCSNRFVMMGGISNQNSNSFSASYQKFSGYKTASVTLKEGQSAEVSVAFTTEDGSIAFDIVNRDGESLFEQTDIGDESFNLMLDQPGKYTLRVTGEDHKGSFHVSWLIQ